MCNSGDALGYSVIIVAQGMEKQQLFLPTESISCHAWNGDRTMVAVCPNNHELHIFSTTPKWERLHVFKQHDLVISGVDWSAKTNKIVTCSHDRYIGIPHYLNEYCEVNAVVFFLFSINLILLCCSDIETRLYGIIRVRTTPGNLP